MTFDLSTYTQIVTQHLKLSNWGSNLKMIDRRLGERRWNSRFILERLFPVRLEM